MEPHWVNVCDREPDLDKEVHVLVIRLGTEIEYAKAKATRAGWVFSAKPISGQIVAWLESDHFLSEKEIREVPKGDIRSS